MQGKKLEYCVMPPKVKVILGWAPEQELRLTSLVKLGLAMVIKLTVMGKH